MFAKDTTSAVMLSVIIGMILIVGRPLWFSSRHGDTTVRLLSLSIALSAVFAFVGWKAFLEDFFKVWLKDNYNDYIPQNQEFMAGMIFLFLAFVIYTINSGLKRDSTGMGIHPESIDKDIPEPSYKDRLYSVCEALTDDLKIIDNKTNWSTHLFTPLDAEVEVNTRNGKERKITDLLKAIKQSKNRLFLVLGAPGAGKSVALRKLCQDLACEVKSTGKIPVYVNLREWQATQKWSQDNPPTIEQLTDFIKSNVMNRDIVTTKFFERYFDKLYETGRLYFVLDSFDEIPEVLNEKENSELIQKLSEVIFRFLKGARQESQGILASRMFRKPTAEFQTEVTLEIRPFSEEKIIQTFQNAGNFDQKIIRKLFVDRPELVPISRNPFSAVLISEFFERNCGRLPLNQSEMYQSYIEQVLHSCSNRIQQKKITEEIVISTTIEIASLMFESYGLEAPVTEISKKLPSFPVDDVIDILKFARLGRAGSGDDNIFSFSHRRFTEYFAVKKIIKENNRIDLEVIPRDSQWRDALVLYCEVVDEKNATRVAEFCWRQLKKSDNLRNPEAIHCLRFLRDAFRGRPECMGAFIDDFSLFLKSQIHEENDVISIQLVVDSLPLLKENEIEGGVEKAMQLENSIVDDVAIGIYRNLSKASDNFLCRVSEVINDKNIFQLFKERKKLIFSFSLSEDFSKILRDIKIRIFSLYVTWVLFFLLIVMYPIASIEILRMVGFFCLLILVIHIFSGTGYRGIVYSKLLNLMLIPSAFSVLMLIFFAVGSYEIGESRELEMSRGISEQDICSNTSCYRLPSPFSFTTYIAKFVQDDKEEKYIKALDHEKVSSLLKNRIINKFFMVTP